MNYYLGEGATNDGNEAAYPDVNFCKDPESICASTAHPELKWISGLFYWTESVQSYKSTDGVFDYMTELKKFVDGGLQNPASDTSFIHGVSGIVNRGCYNPDCGTGALDGGSKRAQNFETVLKAFGLI